jgi:NTF2 fold immunity protein
MRKKITALSRLIFFLGMIQFCNISAQEHSYVPDEGFVPDQITAAALAEAILKPIYGAGNIDRQKPFKIILKNDVWVIMGTLPKGFMGGVAAIEISKKDAKVLRVSHGK